MPRPPPADGKIVQIDRGDHRAALENGVKVRTGVEPEHQEQQPHE